MLKVTGIVTNVGQFTPRPTPENPTPTTYHTLGVEGIAVSMPDAVTATRYPVGKIATMSVIPSKSPNGGFKFRWVPDQV